MPGEKPPGAEKIIKNKLNPHIASSSRIDPQPHQCEASALTTVRSLLLQSRELRAESEASKLAELYKELLPTASLSLPPSQGVTADQYCLTTVII